MATFQMQNYYQPTRLDTAQNYIFEEDEGSVLDDNILVDQSGIDSGFEQSPTNFSRRDSLAVSPTLFSPKTEQWQHGEIQTMGSNNPFADHGNNNNPFIQLDASTYGRQNNVWAVHHTSGMNTPMQGHDGLSTDFEVNAPIYQQRPIVTPFTNPGNQHVPLFGSTNNGAIPESPHKEWTVSDAMEHRSMPKRMRPHSPTLRSHPDMSRRGDGIRKKNARFDIPAERNLNNIDNLIAQSTDENEVKELKQQKRLLRNRQAALDSRQRKKQHTERLEDEKKVYTQAMNELEEDLAEARLALEDFANKEQQYQRYIENMQLEKEEMLRMHTIESGDLRKKVSVLTDHIQRLELAPVAAPTFVNEYADIDSLTMDGAWDNFSILNDFGTEADVKAESMAVAKKNDNTFLSTEPESKPAAQGILLMLLLFGAFVASKGPSPALPTMNEDIRAASTTILQDIFKDAGIQQTATGIVEAMAPLPSGSMASWSSNPMSSMGGNEMVGVTQSTLGDLADRLSRSTEEQNNEQLFSMTAEQYNGITSQDFLQHTPERSTSQGRRNLGESLAAMRNNKKESAAEVYTRSLLWDQVPSEVVRNFARMVSECNSQGRQDENCVG